VSDELSLYKETKMHLNIHRRQFGWVLGGLAANAAVSSSAWASTYPDRPIRFVVPFGTGGNVDNVGRLLAVAMSTVLGQSIVVDNRAGAGGSLGAGSVVQSAADGYTLLVGSNGPLTINPFVQSKLAYSLSDFAPVALAGVVPHVLLANNDVPARTVQELTALSKRQPINCGSSGVGSATHLTMERFNAATGAKLQHVPYRGGATLVPDLLGGAIQLVSMELSTALPLHKSGRARLIAVAGDRRSPLVEEVPTFIESGVTGFTGQSFVGLLAPAKTPAQVLKTLEQAALKVLSMPETVERLQSLGLTPASVQSRGPAGFAKLLQADYDNSRDAVRIANIQPV
jgi:tripartite-type tricarboxylate transporter receptor subunit TctC